MKETQTKTLALLDWQVPLADRQTQVLRQERVMLSACRTGAGKTYLAAQTIKDLKIPTLVVCPKIARSQWRAVLEGMGASQYVLDVINPENLVTSRKQNWYSHAEGWQNIPAGPALLVFDEMHRGASGIYKRASGLGKRTGSGNKQVLMVARWVNKSTPGHKVLALTATPGESPLKMQLLGYLMGFHGFFTDLFYRWCRDHGCTFQERKGHMTLEFTKNRERAKAIMRGIRDQMGERFLSIGPDEIPGFPEETVETTLIDLAKEDHDALVKAYAEMPKDIREIKPGTEAMVELLRLRQQAEFCKAEVLAQMAAKHVEDGCSVFICLNYTDARVRVQQTLRALGVPYVSIYGGQRDSERQQGIAEFQANRVHVLVGMSSACGVALSLHDERHERPRVSLISPGYSITEFTQALGRIRRVGGTVATQRIVLAAGSVEERVATALQRKKFNLNALVDGDLAR